LYKLRTINNIKKGIEKMKKIVCILFIGLTFSMIGCGTAVAGMETPDNASSMKVTGPVVTPTNQPAYLWMNSIKSMI
jgi:hypothetical protein